MPFCSEYPCQHPDRLLRVGTGVLTGEEVLREARTFRPRSGGPPITHLLVDLTAVESVQITNPEMHLIIEMDRAHAQQTPGIPVAIVAARDLVFGLACMYAGLLGGTWTVEVFRTHELAETWLAEVLGSDSTSTVQNAGPSSPRDRRA